MSLKTTETLLGIETSSEVFISQASGFFSLKTTETLLGIETSLRSCKIGYCDSVSKLLKPF